MNISYNWLKDMIDIDLSPSELGQKLTNVGLAVEGVHAHGDDFVLDVDLTSNRPDCLSHLGVAREIGVITRSNLTAETQRCGESEAEIPLPTVLAGNFVRIEDADLCHRFTARFIKNVKIGPSPQWLVDRLETIGERSINNVADITNYVMHDLGQPMHSFDLDKLAEKRIVVRRARAGETITTLDEVERKLDGTMLAICDAEKPVAVAGIMGGLDSSITETTVNVLLEVAYFKRENIRATSRQLNLNTEASYRFERGVDIENLIRASDRASKLICELAGGEAGDLIDVYPTVFIANLIESADISASVRRLTGLDVATDECIRILNSLGIEAKNISAISNLESRTFISPSWRHDIAIEEDLVEEIARNAGYENIANELPPAYGAGEYQTTESRKKVLRQTLVDMGFDEAISYSFIDTKHDEVYKTVPGVSNTNFVTLQDSVIDGAVRMRPTILPGLFAAVRLNFNHQRRDLKLFELGKVFSASVAASEPPTEQELLSLVVTGGEFQQNRAMPVRDLDFYDAKGAVEAALDAVGVANVAFSAADVKHLRQGQAASIFVSGKAVGYVGRLADDIVADYKFRQPVYAAEVNLKSVFSGTLSAPVYRPLPRYPGVVRDVSLLTRRDVTFASIRDATFANASDICRSLEFVDVYEGKGMPENERSITIRIEYRSDERTLTESEVDALHKQIVENLEQTLDIKPRF